MRSALRGVCVCTPFGSFVGIARQSITAVPRIADKLLCGQLDIGPGDIETAYRDEYSNCFRIPLTFGLLSLVRTIEH